MNIEKEISKTILHLNSKELTPVKGFRRNVEIYELVCFVNNIIGCYLSKNHKPIKIFIERIQFYMNDKQPDSCNRDYIELVKTFIQQMNCYLETLEEPDKKPGHNEIK